MRYAVIDLGTNTFHLLIVEVGEETPWKELYRERMYVKLADEGIETIGQVPFARGVDALRLFSEAIQKYNVKEVQALGTAALRTASNGQDFIAEVAKQTQIQIQTISGDEEARLIYKGARQAIDMNDKPMLLMDIGGGSVEFILANNTTIFWRQSFPIGVAVLYRGFHQSEPMEQTEIERLQTFLDKLLQPLVEAAKEHPVQTLVGASGTFDVLADAFGKQEGEHASSVDATLLPKMFKRVIKKTLVERLEMKEIPKQRARLVVVAFLLIEHVINNVDIKDILISDYAMKEGALSEMITA